jgi:hypothetical protein
MRQSGFCYLTKSITHESGLASQRFTPVVDRFAYVVDSLHSKTKAEGQNGDATKENSADAYQYQRAYRLSVDLRDTIYAASTAQIRQIQEHNVLV